ncbi:MAG: transposase, partial [Cyanobacteria bacterium P01_E01_bin.34]
SSLLLPFAHLFSASVWTSAQVLVVGAILAPGKRTVSAILRVMGLGQQRQFQNYHRVLNRAHWSSLAVSRVLLHLLLAFFQPVGPLVFGLDDTLERRKGAKIKAKGIYRDPVRSSRSHFVKASGLRWLSLMLLAEIPWAERVWALPVLTALAPSERYHHSRNRRHKTLTDWGRQVVVQVRRWLPLREIVVTGDSSFAALEFLAALHQLSHPVHVVTRLRLDAALYDPASPRQPGQMGRPRLKGRRLPTLKQVLSNSETHWQTLSISPWYGGGKHEVDITTGTAVWYHVGKPVVPIRWVLLRDPQGQFEPQALLCTHLDYSPEQIVRWFVRRWQVEVTFEQVRAHLGVETQRQWSDLAIDRTTPALLGLFSFVTLMAHQMQRQSQFNIRQAAWYSKSSPTFADAMAWVRSVLWFSTFSMSHDSPEMVKVSRSLLDRMTDALIYAA